LEWSLLWLLLHHFYIKDADYFSGLTLWVKRTLPSPFWLQKMTQPSRKLSRPIWSEKVLTAENGERALEVFSQHLPEFVILDITMPKKNGWEVLSTIKKVSDVPVLMLTAVDTDIDKVFALRTGADDYMIKPFNPSELVARVLVILKRMNHHQFNENLTVYKTKNIELNVTAHQVFIGESMQDISPCLTTTEYRILLHLVRFPKRVFTRKELIEACLPA